MNNIRYILIIVLIAAIGCGGGSGNSGDTSPIKGRWVGSLKRDTTDTCGPNYADPNAVLDVEFEVDGDLNVGEPISLTYNYYSPDHEYTGTVDAEDSFHVQRAGNVSVNPIDTPSIISFFDISGGMATVRYSVQSIDQEDPCILEFAGVMNLEGSDGDEN